MRRSARTLPALLLLSAVLVGMMYLQDRPPDRPSSRFRFDSPDEARAFVLTRILAAERIDPALEVYASTYWRIPPDGSAPEFLVAEPARELELAEAFAEHGFHQEALVHLENLLTYHPVAPEARKAARRLPGCRKDTLFGLVAPESAIAEQGGDLRVPAVPGSAGSRRMETVDLERLLARLHEPFLPLAPAGPPEAIVGRVDDRGECRYEATVSPPAAIEPDAYRLPRGCPSLYAAERAAKRALLDRHLEPLPEGSPLRSRVTAALVYLGYVDDARRHAEARDESLPENPLRGDLRALAADPAHPLALDARWLLRRLEPPTVILAGSTR